MPRPGHCSAVGGPGGPASGPRGAAAGLPQGDLPGAHIGPQIDHLQQHSLSPAGPAGPRPLAKSRVHVPFNFLEDPGFELQVNDIMLQKTFFVLPQMFCFDFHPSLVSLTVSYLNVLCIIITILLLSKSKAMVLNCKRWFDLSGSVERPIFR